MQIRDKLKFDSLIVIYQERFIKASQLILRWLKTNCKLVAGHTIALRRLPDNEAKSGNITDIEIIYETKKINLSIKHNHKALKHQRPSALPQQFGLVKNETQDHNYRNEYQAICKAFINKSNQLLNGVIQFNELKNIDPEFINTNLYEPICSLVCKYIQEWSSNPESVKYFFRFIVGITNFYKVIVGQDFVEIYGFEDIPPPKKMKCEIISNSYIHVTFDNNWKISMRLHTASSRLKGVSLKFDTTPLEMSIPLSLIHISEPTRPY